MRINDSFASHSFAIISITNNDNVAKNIPMEFWIWDWVWREFGYIVGFNLGSEAFIAGRVWC